MKLPRIILTAACAAIAAFLAFRRSGNGDGEEFPPPDPVLSRTVSHFDCTDLQFSQALQVLSRQAGVPIRGDEAALARGGINPGDTVTVRYSDGTVAGALQILLVDTRGGSRRLGYRIKDGSIIVSTYADSVPELICRVYPVGDLIDQMETFDIYTEAKSSRQPMRVWRFPWQGTDAGFASYTDWEWNRSASVPRLPKGRVLRAWVLWWCLQRDMEEQNSEIASVRRSVGLVGDRIVLVAMPKVHEAFARILKQFRRHDESGNLEDLLQTNW